jgi:hypothetical protein
MRLNLSNFASTLFISVFLWVPSTARADVAYTVSPLVITETFEAREIVTRTISFENTGNQPLTLYPSVNNISLKEGGTIEEFLPPSMSDRTQSLAAWIEISRSGINIPIGGKKSVEVTFRIAPNPAPGTYHALIGFGNGRNQDEAIAHVKAGRAPGTIVTVTIEEKKSTLLKLSGFIVDRFVTKPENQAALYTFKNSGDTVVTPQGEILFYDGKGAEVGAVRINEEGTPIPPGEEKVFGATVPTSGLFGKYKAYLSVSYGDTQKATVNDTAFFYIIPLKSVLIAFGLLAVLIAFFAWYFHRKYLDEDLDDSTRLHLHVRDSVSEPKIHDVVMKN